MTNPSYTYHLIAENDLTPDQHKRIRVLLMKAFPKHAHHFETASYDYTLPEYRLWMEDEQGTILAHLDLEHRLIDVDGIEVSTIGIGEVSTHPDYQGQGLGRMLMNQLKVVLHEQFRADYGILLCGESVAGYYERVGWHRLKQVVYEQDKHSGENRMSHEPAMILPIHKRVDEWHTDGIVDIRGLPW